MIDGIAGRDKKLAINILMMAIISGLFDPKSMRCEMLVTSMSCRASIYFNLYSAVMTYTNNKYIYIKIRFKLIYISSNTTFKAN